jgi:hypothetical protein
MVGKEFTVIVAVVETVQVPALPIMVYVWDVPGVAVITLPVVALNPVAGLQVNKEALLLAVKVAVCCPTQMVGLFTVRVGLLITETVDTAVFVQLLVVPVIV